MLQTGGLFDLVDVSPNGRVAIVFAGGPEALLVNGEFQTPFAKRDLRDQYREACLEWDPLPSQLAREESEEYQRALANHDRNGWMLFVGIFVGLLFAVVPGVVLGILYLMHLSNPPKEPKERHALNDGNISWRKERLFGEVAIGAALVPDGKTAFESIVDHSKMKLTRQDKEDLPSIAEDFLYLDD